VPLLESKGGALIVNSQEIRLVEERGASNPINYLVGTVSQKGEGMAGHHAAYTLCIMDEASGLDDQVHVYAQGWMKKMLAFGNANPCNNFFRRAVREGDVARAG
jgi:hypothetical protein